MAKTGVGPLAVDDRDLRRATLWLGEHRFTEVVPTTLLAARLAMRWRAKTGMVIAGMLLVVPYLIVQVWAMARPHSDAATAMARLLAFSAVILVVLIMRCLETWRTSRGERSLAAALPVRTAHADRIGLRQLLGVRRRSAIVLHGGSAALILVVITTSRSVETRTQAWVSLTAMVVMLALCSVEVSGIVRRPTLAEDEVSLRVDDVLRTEEAHLAVSPMLSVLLITQSGLQARHAWVTLMLIPLLVLLVVDGVLTTTAIGRVGRRNAGAVTIRS